MIQLDQSVPLINLQFSFSNPRIVPEWIGGETRETVEGREVRKSRTSGEEVIKPTHNCSLLRLIDDLSNSGYVLTDAFCQKRPNVNKSCTYWMARFVFMRSELTKESGFELVRHMAMANLVAMCADAMWRLRVFVNPFFKDGEAMTGQNSISINLESRKPLRTPDGPLVMVWQRDRNGQSLKGIKGAKKILLVPDHHLHIEKGAILLAEA